MKKMIIVAVVTVVLGGIIFYFINNRQTPQAQEQIILENTLNISREYAALRYQTDNVLINAESYADYDGWNSEMTAIIKDWATLEKEATILENLANETAEEKVSLKFVKTAQTYTKEEVTSVIDKAPMGKKITTLAKHLGVDAKMAQLILNETQNMISREAYGEEGDVFQKCENQAIVVKNASKVTVFVGTIALTGGTAAIATGGTLGQAAVIVSGADLTLEITDDTAKMALGNNNKISTIAGDVRKITEPAAAILMVSTLPNNLVKGIDKLNAVVFGADQLNGTIQSGSVIGIKLPTPTKEKPKPATEVSVLEKEELDSWIKENDVKIKAETKEDIEKVLGIGEESEGNENMKEVDKNISNQSNHKIMSLSEFNDLVDGVILENISRVKEMFGEPDKIITREDGYFDYIYNGRIKFENGTIGSFTLRFNNSTLQGSSTSLKNY